MACTVYCRDIEEILDTMIYLAYEVLQENRRYVELYVGRTWALVTSFVQSIKSEEGTGELASKFKSYIDAEKTRIEKNLVDIKYRIDGPDTFRVVAGEGRLETVSGVVCDNGVFCAIFTRTCY